MARLIVACPACKARFDVSNFRPGSKIRCGSCYKILRIPDRTGSESIEPAPAPARAPAKKAPPADPPKAPPRAKPKKAAPAPKAEAAKPKSEPLSIIGTKIGGEFEIVRALGEGGYGAVYEATDLTLKRKVAVKVMLKNRTSNDEFVQKFLREARTAAQLSHPNIVKIHLVGFDKDLQQHFLAMEYVEGKTLGDILSEEGPLPLDRAVDIIVQAANGLGEAHRKSIIHRDIKPGNIMITAKGVVKVADFGLAKIYDPAAKASTIIGTPYFMPPEQFEGKARDGRTDIYSLGITFYYLLTGRRPFEGTTPAQVLLNVMKQDPTPPQKYVKDVPEGIWTVIQKMIARDVEQRYSTCEELLRDLRVYREAADAEEKLFCPSCGFGNAPSTDKCVECKTSLLEPCPSCGTADRLGAKFCGNCGANLAQEKEIAGIVAEAESHAAAGRFDKAVVKYQEAQETAPDNSRVIEALRRAEQSLAERDEAVAELTELLEGEKVLKALKRAEEAAERFPTYGPIADLLAKARERSRDALLASEMTEAREFLDAGRLFDACAAARRALEIDPHSEPAARLLEEAEDAMERHGAARDRAAGHEREHRLEDALAAWREALELQPNDEGARHAIARLEEMVAQIQRHRTRAEDALKSRDLKAARLAVEDAVRIFPSDPSVVDILDRLRVEEHKLEQGIEKALEHAMAGRGEEAVTTLDALTEVFPDDDAIRSVREQAAGFVRAADQLVSAGRAWLGRHRPETAALFARAAQRFAALEGRADSLLTAAKEEKKAQMEALANVRALIEKGGFAEAETLLDSFGGAASAVAEIAQLARQAAAGRAEQEAEEAPAVATPEPA